MSVGQPFDLQPLKEVKNVCQYLAVTPVRSTMLCLHVIRQFEIGVHDQISVQIISEKL